MRRVAVALALALALAGTACKKQQEEPPPGPPSSAIGEAELKRGRDACQAYVEQVCACAKTVAAAARPCELAKALPESIEVAMQVSAHPETERKDVVQSASAVRKAIARCIEQTVRLPQLGCPAMAPGR
jgi:hypothetical protein